MREPVFTWLENGLETKLYTEQTAIDKPLSFRSFLYATAAHLNAQSAGEKFCFYLFRPHQDTAIASIYFIEKCDVIISIPEAPFGGIQCDDQCKAHEISFLLQCINSWFSQRANIIIRIKAAPSIYFTPEMWVLLTKSYELSGYQVTQKFINYHIPVSSLPFSELITLSERRRLIKSKKSGFIAGMYKQPDIELVNNFVKKSREASGYPMSITLNRLKNLIEKFPKQCLVFTVTDAEKIIAMSVTVLASNKILYNFLPAYLRSYKNYSPMVYLTESIYNYCQNENITILDLGISTDHNAIEKNGLLKFKRNLGAQESEKITYEIMLNAGRQMPRQLPSL